MTTPAFPNQPVGLTATASTDDSITLAWTDGAAEDSYKVQRSTDNVNWSLAGTVAANTTTFTDSGLSEVTRYYYRVIASNAIGESAASTAVNRWTLPIAPNGLTATVVSATQINLSWTDQSTKESAYFVEQSSDGGVNWTQIASNLAANTQSYSATGPFNGAQSYRFRVRANSAGGYSTYSPEASVTTPAFPNQPVGLTATSSTDDVTLHWDDVENETEYLVERRTADDINWTVIDSVLADSTSFIDTGLDAEQEYLYRIIAKNAVGSSVPSLAVYWGSGPDSDTDGLRDLEEDLLGTNPNSFDSDGDLLGDGFEVHGGMNPINADEDGNGVRDDRDDFDGDGLNNLREATFDTAPNNSDSDGDGAGDGTEVDQGSDPNDSSDMGQPPEDDRVAKIRLTVGDPSGSQSERYEFVVGPIRHQAPEFGVVSTAEYTLQTGSTYSGQIYHRGTDPNNSWTRGNPNYDWTASIGLGAGEDQLIIVDDRQTPDSEPSYPDQILRTHIWNVLGTPFLADGKTVQVHIPRVDLDVIDFSGNEMADNDEVRKGGAAFVNKDDDDEDGILDFEDPHIAGGDNDFVELKLHDLVPPGLDEFDGGILLTFNTARIRIWKDRNKDEEVVSGTTELAIDTEHTLYLEGIAASDSYRDVELKARYVPRNLPSNVVRQGSKAEDVIRVTVLDVDIDTDSDNNKHLSRSDAEEAVEAVEGQGKELIFNVPDDVTLTQEEPEAIAKVVVEFPIDLASLEGDAELRLTVSDGLNVWQDSTKTQPLNSDSSSIPSDPEHPESYTWTSFSGEIAFWVEGNLEGLDRYITWELVIDNEVRASDKVFFSFEEYIDIRPIEELAKLNTTIGEALAGDALQYLTSAEYQALKDAGLEVGRYDGLWDYVFLKIGNNYYTYIEPSLWGSYKLFSIAPDTVSIAALQQGAEIANWLVGLGALDVGLSVLPGGTSAGYVEQGDYAHAALWFVADVGLTLSVVGKLGQVTAKVGSVVKSGSAIRIGKALNNVGKIGQYRNVVLGGTVAAGILGAESGVGAVSDVMNGQYVPASIKALDAVFAALGVSTQGRQYFDTLRDAAKAEKKLVEKVDVQQVASKTSHGTSRALEEAGDYWCFAPATLVATAFGRRPIGEIEASDEVFAFDFDRREYVLARVQKRHNNLFNGNFLTINLSNGDKIEVTTNHPIWVVSGEELGSRDTPPHDGIQDDEGKSIAGRWLNSQHLRKGDKLHSRRGMEVEVTDIESRFVIDQPVCNLTVVGYHNYLITNTELLAHNDPSWCDILIEKGWTSAKKDELMEMAVNANLQKSAVHGHHIVMKNSDDPASIAARQILIDYGIPVLGTKAELQAATDLSNMAMAIGRGHLGIHTQPYADKVLELLSDAVAIGGSNDEIRQRLRDALGFMRGELENGRSFW